MIVNTDDILDLFGISDKDIYAKGTIEDAIYDGTLHQVEPERKTGKWIRVYSRPHVLKYLGWTCSECGYRNGEEYAPHWHKFCPGCGAMMERCDQDGEG